MRHSTENRGSSAAEFHRLLGRALLEPPRRAVIGVSPAVCTSVVGSEIESALYRFFEIVSYYKTLYEERNKRSSRDGSLR